jgi:hypothetical protein
VEKCLAKIASLEGKHQAHHPFGHGHIGFEFNHAGFYFGQTAFRRTKSLVILAAQSFRNPYRLIRMNADPPEASNTSVRSAVMLSASQ